MNPEDKILFLFENAVKIASAIHAQDDKQGLSTETQLEQLKGRIDTAYTMLEDNLNSRLKDLPRPRPVPVRR